MQAAANLSSLKNRMKVISGEFPLLTLMQRHTSLFRTFCIVAEHNPPSADEDLLPGCGYGRREELQYDGLPGVVCQCKFC